MLKLFIQSLIVTVSNNVVLSWVTLLIVIALSFAILISILSIIANIQKDLKDRRHYKIALKIYKDYKKIAMDLYDKGDVNGAVAVLNATTKHLVDYSSTIKELGEKHNESTDNEQPSNDGTSEESISEESRKGSDRPSHDTKKSYVKITD